MFVDFCFFVKITSFREYESVLDAAAKGVASAIQLVLGIIASLIAFLALVYWANGILAFMGELVGKLSQAYFLN